MGTAMLTSRFAIHNIPIACGRSAYALAESSSLRIFPSSLFSFMWPCGFGGTNQPRSTWSMACSTLSWMIHPVPDAFETINLPESPFSKKTYALNEKWVVGWLWDAICGSWVRIVARSVQMLSTVQVFYWCTFSKSHKQLTKMKLNTARI